MDPVDSEVSAEVEKESSPPEFLVDENTFVEPNSFIKKLLAEASAPQQKLAGHRVSATGTSYQENENRACTRRQKRSENVDLAIKIPREVSARPNNGDVATSKLNSEERRDVDSLNANLSNSSSTACKHVESREVLRGLIARTKEDVKDDVTVDWSLLCPIENFNTNWSFKCPTKNINGSVMTSMAVVKETMKCQKGCEGVTEYPDVTTKVRKFIALNAEKPAKSRFGRMRTDVIAVTHGHFRMFELDQKELRLRFRDRGKPTTVNLKHNTNLLLFKISSEIIESVEMSEIANLNGSSMYWKPNIIVRSNRHESIEKERQKEQLKSLLKVRRNPKSYLKSKCIVRLNQGSDWYRNDVALY